MGEDRPDESLLAREVVVEGRNIHPRSGRDLAGAQSLETVLRDLTVRGAYEAGLPLGRSGTRLRRRHPQNVPLNQLIDTRWSCVLEWRGEIRSTD